ncbi:MAG: hypothetical protein EBQ96_00025 [Proteobacteria bacterium]|nr:hypothetical protein [Pseudomonadota bacterium]
MANYTLLVLTFNDEAHRALRADNRFGQTLERISTEAKSIPKSGDFNSGSLHVDEAQVVAELTANGKAIGTIRGMFYDARIVKTKLQPNEIACVIRHDHVGSAASETGKPAARSLRDFKKCVAEGWQFFCRGSDALVPVFWNNTDQPLMVEVHKTHARADGDPNTRWEYHSKTTYISLVNQ